MIADHRRLFDLAPLFLGAVLITSTSAASNKSSVIQVRAEVDKDFAHILSAVQVKANPDLTTEPMPGWTVLQIVTRDRKYSAYLLCVPLKSKEDPERCAHRVYFDDYTGTRPPKIYEIRGEEELQEIARPIDKLKWLNNYTLSYDRWAQPHFGHRYVIDLRSKKQVVACNLFG